MKEKIPLYPNRQRTTAQTRCDVSSILTEGTRGPALATFVRAAAGSYRRKENVQGADLSSKKVNVVGHAWVWCNGSITAFQAVGEGSNPFTHSNSILCAEAEIDYNTNWLRYGHMAQSVSAAVS